MKVCELQWQRFPGRIEDRPGRCPNCRKAVAALPPAPTAGDLTACPVCLAPLRFGEDSGMHKVRDTGVTRLIYEHPLIAVELLNLIERCSQAQRAA
jgi:hypothetical protein